MAGIYLHIPFCQQACHYCDFHFSTSLRLRAQMVQAMCQELRLQSKYLQRHTVQSIYFGGGTPSLLTAKELQQLLAAINQHYEVAPAAEVTLEANPDDLETKTLDHLMAAGINRLSVGIQSFHQRHLEYMNRSHSAKQAEAVIPRAQEMGFDNISIDLIYGLPADGHHIWKRDLEKALELKVQHISAYCLTIEPKTVFGRWLKQGKIQPVGEHFSAEQFEWLMETLTKVGYQHYEISNFCLPGRASKHNSSYWGQELYLGIGPSAHSYDGNSRQFNISNNKKYLDALTLGKIPATKEHLSKEDRINEYVMTSLRTDRGCDLAWLKEEYNYDLATKHLPLIESLIAQGLVTFISQQLGLTNRGKLLADQITTDLFII